MPKKNVVSDYNGAVFENEDATERNKKLAFGLLKRNLSSHPLLATTNLAGIIPIYWTLNEYKKDKERTEENSEEVTTLSDVYDVFNTYVIDRADTDFYYEILDEFAEENSDKLDGRILDSIKKGQDERKIDYTGMLSLSDKYSIGKMLEEGGYGNVFDEIIANKMNPRWDGRAGELTLDINEDNKGEEFEEEFFDERGFREDDTIYFGDSEDDEPIAEILVPGNFVVPFFASGDFKNKMESKYSAFVPKNKGDLKNYLVNG